MELREESNGKYKRNPKKQNKQVISHLHFLCLSSHIVCLEREWRIMATNRVIQEESNERRRSSTNAQNSTQPNKRKQTGDILSSLSLSSLTHCLFTKLSARNVPSLSIAPQLSLKLHVSNCLYIYIYIYVYDINTFMKR